MNEIQTGIPCEVDGETVYLSPSSAEGKALQRIRNPISEDEWVTEGEIGEDIDVDALNKRLRKRGYKVQVSFKATSTVVE